MPISLNNLSKKAKRGAQVAGASTLLIALPLTATWEGIKLKPYLDIGGVPTYCYGETENVQWNRTYTTEECKELLSARLGYFAFQVDRAVGVPMSPKIHAALTSWTYNVGVGAMQKSTLIKRINSGDYRGACDQLLRWNRVGGKVIRGLTNRRQAERKICLEGINEL